MDSQRQMEKTVNFAKNYGTDEQVREIVDAEKRSADKMLIMAGGAQHGKTALMEKVRDLAKDDPNILVLGPGDKAGVRGGLRIVEDEFLGDMERLMMPKLDTTSARLALEAMAEAGREAEEKAKKLRKALVPRRDLGVGYTRQVVGGQKPGRNQLCPCGSMKKYKKCCGR